MQGKMQCCGRSDIGNVRSANEDQFLIAELNKSLRIEQTSLDLDLQTRLYGESQGTILLVADGMGGHAAGRRASTLAVDSLATYVINAMPWLDQAAQQWEDTLLEQLADAFRHCQRSLIDEVAAIPDRKGMGTTLTLALVVWPHLFVVHVGDSRCYVQRGSQLQQLTRDHTLAQQLVDAGDLDAGDAEASQLSNVLWNVIGGDSEEVTPDAFRTELQVGDVVLLCTDGLIKHVAPGQISSCLEQAGPIEAVCEGLIDAAKTGGGSDNVTVVVARFLTPEQAHELAEEVALGTEDREASPFADTEPHLQSTKTVDSLGEL